jgi:iduronate 2-sulfatase
MLRTALAAAAVAAVAAPPPDLGLKNVLLIVIDDLRPQLGAYGLEEMHTPHIDRLASEGVLFTRAYAQQAICGPTRNSFMSGRYPEKTLTWNFIEWV